ncbi:unnamed protein product [Lactuca saligna]|uniref:Zinc finger DNA-directed DNA polymerase family B alpha domain-containing protein n=1 Tax=Lactuca saligna TaxID=75948 RepID=A0AA35YYK8_LACSI|nr:unnamed protein product [Lactuca saligna]
MFFPIIIFSNCINIIFSKDCTSSGIFFTYQGMMVNILLFEGSSGYNTTTTFWQKFCCPKCQVELPPTSLSNQIKRRIEFFISTYYKGIMTCDDETCDYTTWSLNLHVVGESERGTVCPNYLRCNGRLVRRLKATVEKEVGRIRGLVGLAFSTAQKVYILFLDWFDATASLAGSVGPNVKMTWIKFKMEMLMKRTLVMRMMKRKIIKQ